MSNCFGHPRWWCDPPHASSATCHHHKIDRAYRDPTSEQTNGHRRGNLWEVSPSRATMAHRDTSGSALCRELGIRPVRRTAGRAATGTNGARWEVHERPEAPRPLALPRRLRAPARRAGVFRDTTAVSPGRAERHGRRGRGSPNGARPPDIEALEVLESLQQPGWRPELSRSQQAAPGGRARTAAAPSPACCGAAAWPPTFLQVLVAQGVVPSRSASRLRQGEQGRPLPAGSRHNADRLRPRLETPPGVPGAATSPIWSIPCRTCRSPGWSRGCSPPMGGADRHHDQPRTPDERHQLHEPRARAAESCSASSPGCRPSAHPGHRAPHFLDAPIEVAIPRSTLACGSGPDNHAKSRNRQKQPTSSTESQYPGSHTSAHACGTATRCATSDCAVAVPAGCRVASPAT